MLGKCSAIKPHPSTVLSYLKRIISSFQHMLSLALLSTSFCRRGNCAESTERLGNLLEITQQEHGGVGRKSTRDSVQSGSESGGVGASSRMRTDRVGTRLAYPGLPLSGWSFLHTVRPLWLCRDPRPLPLAGTRGLRPPMSGWVHWPSGSGGLWRLVPLPVPPFIPCSVEQPL